MRIPAFLALSFTFSLFLLLTPSQILAGHCDENNKPRGSLELYCDPKTNTIWQDQADCSHKDTGQKCNESVTSTSESKPAASTKPAEPERTTSSSELINCKNNPVAPPDVPDSENFKYEWKASCEVGCSKNSDCPANTTDASRVEPKTSAWCYQFKEGNRCMKLVSKTKGSPVSKKRVSYMKKYLTGLDKFKKSEGTSSATQKYNTSVTKTRELLKKSIDQGEDCLEETNASKRTRCKEVLKENFGKVKASYRLVKYYSIMSGRSSTCVEADLGMQPRLRGTSMDQHQELRRLFFCSGLNNDEKKLNIKWRVKSKDNKKLVRVSENYALDASKLMNADQLKLAEKKAGF